MCVLFPIKQEEYGEEGLDVKSIPFRDNQIIIDLIAKRPAGLMPILEDQASVCGSGSGSGISSSSNKSSSEKVFLAYTTAATFAF